MRATFETLEKHICTFTKNDITMSADIAPPYTEEELAGDSVSKKDLVTFLQTTASLDFQIEHKLKGAVKNVAKTRTKEQLMADYKDLFDSKSFKQEGEDAKEEERRKKSVDSITEKTKKMEVKDEEVGPPKYTKYVVKKGNKINYPRPGDTVLCYYVGKLKDGTVFDTNSEMRVGQKNKKKNQPLKFKVGTGQVIRGWDEGVQKMSLGETAELRIEAEWAYGRKGLEGKIPPNTPLVFEVDLVGIE